MFSMLGKLLIGAALLFIVFTARAESNVTIPIPNESKMCRQDYDCVLVSKNCNHCDDLDAINSTYKSDYDNQFTLFRCGPPRVNALGYCAISNVDTEVMCLESTCEVKIKPRTKLK